MTMVDARVRIGEPTPGRTLVRRLGPVAVVAPLVAGVIVWYLLPTARGHDLSIGIALLTAMMIPAGLAVVFWTARALDRAQAEVEAHRARARDLMDHAAEGVFIGSADGAFTEVNVAGGQLLGYTPDEIIGKRIADLLAPDDVSRLRGSWEAMTERGVHVGEWRLRRKDGSYVPVEVRSRVLEGGRWQGFVRDLTKERQGELSLRRTQEELESIIAISADAIVSVDDQQRIVMYNDGAARIFGWSGEEVYGKPLDILIPERFRAAHRLHIARFAEESTRARKMGERRHIFGLRKSGEEFAADAAISKIEAAGGNLFTVVLRDMTVRIALETELRRTKDLLDNVLESSTEYAVVALDLDRRILLWNEGARRNYGYSSTEVMGKSIDVMSVSMDDEPSSACALALARGCVESVVEQRRQDGSVFVAKRLVAKRLGLGGEPVGYLVMTRDVSVEQDQLAHEKLVAEVGATLAVTLDASELVRRFAELVTRSFADACIVDRFVNGTIVRHVVHRDPSKRAAADGLERLRIDRSRPHLTLPALERQQAFVVSHVTPSYLDAISQGTVHRRLIDELGIVSLVVAPGRVRDRPLGAVAFVSSRPGRHFDARDQARAEELVQRLALALENARLYEVAQKAVLARDGVLGVVAHDLRSPLTAAKLVADMLLSTETSPASPALTAKMIERLQRSLGRASRLIDDLLDVSVIHAGHFSVDAIATRPEGLAREAVEMYASAAEQASLDLTLEVDDEVELPFVLADGGRVVQVLSNLLGNALKFTSAGGRVRVKLDLHRGMVRFAVSDNGCGIAADQTTHLFDEFWQGRRDARGAGLGLAITKGIVEAHGGRIWVESTEGVGSTFYFTLPVVHGAGERRAPSGPI